jgi:Zn-finger nucleic acid-binding protein
MVPVHAAHCPHCGAAVRHEVAEADVALHCPGCRKPLAATTVAGATLDQCLSCGGVWLRQETFEHLAADKEERGQVMGSLPQPDARGGSNLGDLAGVRYRPCAHCGALMNRFNYAHISGVVLDSCKQHGVWFDRDELRQVLAFIERGGLEQSRARELRELDAKRHEVETPLNDLPGGAWADTPHTFCGGTNNLGGGLADLLGNLVGKLFWP